MAATHNITVRTLPTAEEVGTHVAQEILHAIREAVSEGRRPVLGLATGSTPLPTYAALRAIFLEGNAAVDFSAVTTFNLDEYVGLPAGHPESYRSFMFQHLFVPELLHSESNPRGFRKDHIHIPPGEGLAVSADASLLNELAGGYEKLLRQEGPADVQILGIGLNGHIGFNEPGAPIDGATACVPLTESTRQANARFFSSIDEVPTRAITMGVGSILSARKIILIATGSSKADVVMRTLSAPGPLPELPSTALLSHPNAHLVLDSAAASLLA